MRGWTHDNRRTYMTWWYWLVLGLVLIALEMASSGGFYIIFFGVAAVVVALLAATGLVAAHGCSGCCSRCSRSSRSPVPQSHDAEAESGGGRRRHRYAGRRNWHGARRMGAGANGHVELRGTTWSARNTGSTPLRRGQRCVVVRADRLTLLVKAEEAA